MSEYVDVAKIGKTVGVKGDLRLQILSDFPEIIIPGRAFYCGSKTLCVQSFDSKKCLAHFRDYDSKEQSATLTGSLLQCTLAQTRAWCSLADGSYFWFDIIGAHVCENGEVLGVVRAIERIGTVDYLLIATDSALIKAGNAARFMLPFLERFIRDVGQNGAGYRIDVCHAKDILEAS